MMSLQVAKGFGYRINICIKGEGGSQLLFLQRKKDGGRKFLKLWVFQVLLADIVVYKSSEM